MNPFVNKHIAETYDDFYKTENGKIIDLLEKKAISNLLHNIKQNTMLEVGCGTGHWTEYFSSLNIKVTALDISKPMIEIAKAKKIHNAKFIVGDARKLKFQNNTFSLVSAITVLEFTDNPKQILNEMYRVAKQNSHILLGCLNAESYLFKNKTENSIFKYAHLFNKNEIIELLSNYGKVTTHEAVFVDEKLNIYEISDELKSAFVACSVEITK